MRLIRYIRRGAIPHNILLQGFQFSAQRDSFPTLHVWYGSLSRLALRLIVHTILYFFGRESE